MLILSQLVLRGGPSQGGADAVLLKTAAAEQVVRPSLNFVGGGRGRDFTDQDHTLLHHQVGQRTTLYAQITER
jgi:hypothetical protein